MTAYNVTFSMDGSLMIKADSAEAAEREAVEIIEGGYLSDANDYDVDGCTVRVALKFDGDTCSKVERNAKVVEFA